MQEQQQRLTQQPQEFTQIIFRGGSTGTVLVLPFQLKEAAEPSRASPSAHTEPAADPKVEYVLQQQVYQNDENDS
jgi:hypothetical protein